METRAELENVMKPRRERVVRDNERHFLTRGGVTVVAGSLPHHHFPQRKDFRNV